MAQVSVRSALHNGARLGAIGLIEDGIEKELEETSKYENGLSNGLHTDSGDKQESASEGISNAHKASLGFSGNIIDIRRSSSTGSLAELIREGLTQTNGKPKSFPPLALWDCLGLDLFEQITQLPDYYLSRVERDILDQNRQEIAQQISSVSLIVDLGCGDTQKTSILLQTLDDMNLPIEYYALDLSPDSLRSSLARLSFRHVRCHGLLGTFDDAKHWLQTPFIRDRSKCLLSLGSTIGNMPREEAVSLLRQFVEGLNSASSSLSDQEEDQYPAPKARPASFIMVGIDSCIQPHLIQAAYSDPTNLNTRFILNALTHANTVLGYQAFDTKDWIVQGEWVDGGYSQYLIPIVDGVIFEGKPISKGEKVGIVESLKYDGEQQRRLWEQAGLILVRSWRSREAKVGTDPMVSLLRVGDEMTNMALAKHEGSGMLLTR